MSGRSRWLAAPVALALIVSACGSKPRSLQGVLRTPPLRVASVQLPDVSDHGKPFAMRAARGELLLVYFGYTHCPDVCPTTMADVGAALRKLGSSKRQRVSVAMVSVDPERDTAAVMRDFLRHFFPSSHALRTTDAALLAAAEKAFGVQAKADAHRPGEEYAVSHTAITFVVDEHGTVVDEWPFGFESKAMTSDLEVLLGRSNS